ncbi:hypothetical protein V5N11_009620 [Cardamine amara subsp. amara]|uniref:Differentiation-associated protein 1 n=1 Tax=Cardamine amara subsp. amara TaxID=228776 RepID=A0ABD1BKW9_CARAN
MAVSLNSGAGFDSLLHTRYNPALRSSAKVISSKFWPLDVSRRSLISNKKRLVISSSDTDDNVITALDSSSSMDSVKEGSNGSVSSDIQQQTSGKRAPLTARERLRAARVLRRYTEATPKPSKPRMGRQLLDVLKESDKKSNRKPGLPEAPTNMLDDSKRGMPKNGLTFDFPGGSDILVIAFSFVFISTVMFATTYIVWKLGAIHFNE